MAVARRRVSVGLGVAGAACALLGVCLLVVGPIIVKDQVIKVSGAGGVWVHAGCTGAGGRPLRARYGAGEQPGRGAGVMVVHMRGGGRWSRCAFWGVGAGVVVVQTGGCWSWCTAGGLLWGRCAARAWCKVQR